MNKGFTLEQIAKALENRSESDCGRYGKDFESKVKFILNNRKGRLVSPMGRTDTRKLGYKIEIKSNGGKLAYYTETGYKTIVDADLIIYASGYNGQGLEWILDNAIVANATEFYEMLDSLRMVKRNKDGTEYVQGLVSKVKASAMVEILTSFPTLYDWAMDNEIIG